MCHCLKSVEEEGHIFSGQCEVYGDLRSQFGNLQEDKNLVQYFQAVLDRRDILEEEDKSQQSSTAAVGASLRGCSHIMSAKNGGVQTPPPPLVSQKSEIGLPPLPPLSEIIF